MSVADLQSLLIQAVDQSIEQAKDLAYLNLQVSTQTPSGANPEGVGQLLDIVV